ncbi:MAG: acyltransferase [Actinomycetota bacterium]
MWLLRREGASVGERVTIGPRVKVLGVKGLVLENGAGVARDALIDARAGLVVGRQAMVGFESLILSWTHRFDNPEVAIRVQGSYGRPVRIGNGAWIGARVIVLPGIDVGDDAIVGAASVVTRSVAAGAIVAGNPARDIGRRDPAGA